MNLHKYFKINVLKVFGVFVLFQLISNISIAQIRIDPYRLTQFNLGGNARNMSMANSFGVLGSESSAGYFNPAGLAIFTHGELSSSFDYFLQDETFGNFKNSNRDGIFKLKKVRLGIRNVNITYPFIKRKKNKFVKSIVLGFSYNKINKFYDQYTSYVDIESPIETYGKSYDISVSLAYNIKHKLFIGAAISTFILDYKQIFIESHNFPSYPEYSYISEQEYSFDDFCWNYKVGMIYKPFQFLRFGASFQTPRKIIDEDKFILKIPASSSLSAGLVFWRFMAVSAEYQYSNISKLQYDYTDYSDSVYNYSFPNNLDINQRIKAGVELVFGKFSFRAGYMTLFPVSNIIEHSSYSAGIGKKWDYSYIDLAATKTKYNNTYHSYYPVSDNNFYLINITYGVKF